MTPIMERMRLSAGRVALVVALAVGAALLPAVLPFTIDTVEGERRCVAILDGWQAERERPPYEDLRAFARDLAELRPPDSPQDRRVEAYVEWISGPGACVPKSHDRLAITAGGFAAVALFATAMALGRYVLRRRQAQDTSPTA